MKRSAWIALFAAATSLAGLRFLAGSTSEEAGVDRFASPAPGAKPAPAPDASETPPPTEDPAALEAWFERRMLAALEAESGRDPERPDGDSTLAASPSQAAAGRHGEAPGASTRRVSSGSKPVPPELVGLVQRFADRDVDWDYVADVFEGRISGIPSERRAGLTLKEMDELGSIPVVEELRAEKRYDELRDLGFDRETVPWPACTRTGNCRRDRVSSPPGG